MLQTLAMFEKQATVSARREFHFADSHRIGYRLVGVL
jgi:hypothetical protein